MPNIARVLLARALVTQDVAGTVKAFMAARVPTDAAQMLLAEAFDLLAVLGVYPHYHMFWVQSDNWFLSAGMNGGWQFSRSGEHRGRDADVSTEEAEVLAQEYFTLDPHRRNKVLRIPLNRLSRAGREGDFADRAIDLGIALESLLLGDNDPGELSFRLSLRGAWLIGNDEAERLEIQKSLKKLYELRSRAVHSGTIERSAKSGTTIARASEISKSLIRRAIELRCEIDWQRLVIGGGPNDQA